MQYLLVIGFVLSYFVCTAQGLDMEAVRMEFKHGVHNEELCKENIQVLEKYGRSPVEKGYLAAYQMFMAKHLSNPFKKLHQFKKGKNALEELINQNSEEVELRYIRLCIQFYAPKMLGYSSSISEDKKFIIDYLHKMKNGEAKKLIYDYLEGTKMFTDEELALLRR